MPLRALAALAALGAAATLAAAAPADLVFTGGRIYTVDAARSWATALAVSGSRISYVGEDAAALALAGPATRVIDLKGRMVLPGFQDSHVHPGMVVDPQRTIDLHGLTTTTAIFERIATFAQRHRDHAWITGDGWDAIAFPPDGLPTRQMLDALVPDRPALFYDNSGHSAWVNSRALAAAHVTARTADPPNGRIQHDARGAPSGVLHVDAAMDLVAAHIPPQSDADTLHDLIAALQVMRADGYTALEDADAQPAIAQAYRLLDARGELAMHVTLCLPFDPQRDDDAQLAAFIAQRAALAGRLLRADCVKLFVDGAAAGHTLALLAPYSDEPAFGRGSLFIAQDRLDRLVTRLDAAGFQVHMHAQGDWAVRAGLDAIAAAQHHNGVSANRHTIAHLWLVDPADLPRFRALGVVANLSPLWSLGNVWETVDAPRLFGAERTAHRYPGHALRESGAIVVWGSDWPVTGVSALDSIEVAQTHRYPGGLDPLGNAAVTILPDQRISLEQALVSFTSAGAWLLHAEQERGTLETGKLADLVVLDRDLFALPPADIHGAHVELTVFGGRVVYER